MSSLLVRTLQYRLTSAGLTIASAESCTVGRIMSLLGSPHGASSYFKGGICAYTLDAKVSLLGVEAEHASEVNCVSSQVAREMAFGVLDRFGADIGVSSTGYASPDPGRGIHRPMAWLGIRTKDREYAISVKATGQGPWDREAVQQEFAERALRLVLQTVFNDEVF